MSWIFHDVITILYAIHIPTHTPFHASYIHHFMRLSLVFYVFMNICHTYMEMKLFYCYRCITQFLWQIHVFVGHVHQSYEKYECPCMICSLVLQDVSLVYVKFTSLQDFHEFLVFSHIFHGYFHQVSLHLRVFYIVHTAPTSIFTQFILFHEWFQQVHPDPCDTFTHCTLVHDQFCIVYTVSMYSFTHFTIVQGKSQHSSSFHMGMFCPVHLGTWLFWLVHPST